MYQGIYWERLFTLDDLSMTPRHQRDDVEETPESKSKSARGRCGWFSFLVDRRRHQSCLDRLDELRLGHRGKFMFEMVAVHGCDSPRGNASLKVVFLPIKVRTDPIRITLLTRSED